MGTRRAIRRTVVLPECHRGKRVPGQESVGVSAVPQETCSSCYGSSH